MRLTISLFNIKMFIFQSEEYDTLIITEWLNWTFLQCRSPHISRKPGGHWNGQNCHVPWAVWVHVRPAAIYVIIFSAYYDVRCLGNPVLSPILLLEIQLGFLHLSLSSLDRWHFQSSVDHKVAHQLWDSHFVWSASKCFLNYTENDFQNKCLSGYTSILHVILSRFAALLIMICWYLHFTNFK